ncbi:hypothetical protein GM921_12450 [Pedobacter sp. LMG 31464]|uniref:Uncharacterized protein n=1 Tax=Pedobacter planticolens TaxID=2679964 RepID=A0A923E0S7_9SPHI|nr:hypothetical protein [Pedobacter planticolens]MBB2146303.1 hypothetical protein [Pedobacter planticolens]
MKHLTLFVLLLFSICSCNNQKENKEETPAKVADTIKEDLPKDDGLSQQDSIKATGRQILIFLKENNFKELSKYFSNEGVRFSPYGFIDTAKSKKLTPEDFLESIHKKWLLTWGSLDGTGDPIKLTVPAYLKKFAYNADYLNAEAVGYDEIMKQGNSLNNLKTIYPNHHFIDYYFSGFDQKNQGMDWTSLRLVFEKEDGQYFLVAIIHDQWTI